MATKTETSFHTPHSQAHSGQPFSSSATAPLSKKPVSLTSLQSMDLPRLQSALKGYEFKRISNKILSNTGVSTSLENDYKKIYGQRADLNLFAKTMRDPMASLETMKNAFRALPQPLREALGWVVWKATGSLDTGDLEFGTNALDQNPTLLLDLKIDKWDQDILSFFEHILLKQELGLLIIHQMTTLFGTMDSTRQDSATGLKIYELLGFPKDSCVCIKDRPLFLQFLQALQVRCAKTLIENFHHCTFSSRTPMKTCKDLRKYLATPASIPQQPVPEQPEGLLQFAARTIKASQAFHRTPRFSLTPETSLNPPSLDQRLITVSQDPEAQQLSRKVAQHLASLYPGPDTEALSGMGITELQWGAFEDRNLPEWVFQIVSSNDTPLQKRASIEKYSDVLQTIIAWESLPVDLPRVCILPASNQTHSLFLKIQKKPPGESQAFKTVFPQLPKEEQTRLAQALCRFIFLTGYNAVILDKIYIVNGRLQLHDLPLHPHDSLQAAKLAARSTLERFLKEPWEGGQLGDYFHPLYPVLRNAVEQQIAEIDECEIESPSSISAFRTFASAVVTGSSKEDQLNAFDRLPSPLKNNIYHYVWSGIKKTQIGENDFALQRTRANLDIVIRLTNRDGMTLLQQLEVYFSLIEILHILRLTKRCLAQDSITPLTVQILLDALRDTLLGSIFTQSIVQHLTTRLQRVQLDALNIEQQLHASRNILLGSEKRQGLLDMYIHTIDACKRSISLTASRERTRYAKQIFSMDIEDRFPLRPTPLSQVQVKSNPGIPVENRAVGMRVLLVAYECATIGLSLGGLGGAVYGMAKSLQQRGCKVTILMPKFTGLDSELATKNPELLKRINDKNTPKSVLKHPVAGAKKKDRLWTLQEEGMTCIWLEDTNTQRNVFNIPTSAAIYTDGNLARPDREWHGLKERMAYLGSAAAEYIISHAEELDAVIYNDWHAAYAIDRIASRYFTRWISGEFPANVFVIHNNSYGCQGVYEQKDADILHMFGDDRPGLNVLLSALELADRCVTVSETFALEMQGGPLTSGIGQWVRQIAHQGKFKGIINGSNSLVWNPETNKVLKSWKDPETGVAVDLSFSPQTPDLVAHKQLIRRQLFKALKKHYPEALESLGCQTAEDLIRHPLFLYVGRYDSTQKGLDKLKEILLAAKDWGGRLITMGSGEDTDATEILDDLQNLATREKRAWITRGDSADSSKKMQNGDEERGRPALGPLIRSAADFCIVPSSFEPCGLVQSEGWLFGMLAIGTKTGGLSDTIITDPAHPRFNGFTFDREWEWDSAAQSAQVKETLQHALTWWLSLNNSKKHALMAKLITDGRALSWTTAPDGLSPVNRYLVLLQEAIADKHNRFLQPTDLLGMDAIPPPARDGYFGSGMQCRLYQIFGAHIQERGVRFRVMAPAARSVHVVLFGSKERESLHPMQKREDGSWEALVENAQEGSLYQYEIETSSGELVRKNDPFAFGFEILKEPRACVVTRAPQDFLWTDAEWISVERSMRKKGPRNIYEVHVPSYIKRHGKYINYRELGEKLAEHCVREGYTYVEIFGAIEHFVDGTMGYQVAGFFAASSRNGKLQDFQAFVDILHKNKIGVILDFVPYHFIKDQCSLKEFDGTTFFEAPDMRNRNSGWGTLVFDYDREDVRNYLLSSVHFFLKECHLDGLRIDAVSNLLAYCRWRDFRESNPGKDGTYWNRGAFQFLKEMNRMAHSPELNAYMISENSWEHYYSDTAPVDHSSGLGLGFDLRFNMPARSVVHEFFSKTQKERANPDIKNYFMQKVTHKPEERFISTYYCHDEVANDYGYIAEFLRNNEDSEEDLQNKIWLFYALNGFAPQHARLMFMGTELGLEGKSEDKAWDPKVALEWDELLRQKKHQECRDECRRVNHFYLTHRALWDAGENLNKFQWILLETEEPVIAYERMDPEEPNRLRYLVVHNFGSKYFERFQILWNQKLAIQKLKTARIVFRTGVAPELLPGPVTVLHGGSQSVTGFEIPEMTGYGTVVIEEELSVDS